MILLALACRVPPTWTDDNALASHRARMDRDHDGRVDAAEYSAVTWSGPPFASVDANRNGDLETRELVTLFLTQSPTRFDDAGGAASALSGGDAASRGAHVPAFTAEKRATWETLYWVRDSLPNGSAIATDDVIDAAVASGSLTSEASLLALGPMQAAWEAAGWVWPIPPPLSIPR